MGNKTNIAEYIKIRQYIINLLMKSGTQPELIASNREMEKKFGVSRPTVQKALRDLIADGYLTAKPGIGTFTNPHQRIGELNGNRQIGIISGDGKMALYDRFMWKLMSCTGDKLLEKYQNYCLQPCSLIHSNEHVIHEIRQMGLSGLIWILPPRELAESIRRLKHEHGLPLVVVDEIVEGVSSILPDLEKEGYELARRMLQEQRKNIIFIYQKNTRMEDGLAGIRRAYSESGLKFNEHQSMESNNGMLDNLGKMIDFGVEISGIIAFIMGGKTLKLLRSKNIDIIKDCRIAAHEWTLTDDMNFHGFVIRNHLDRIAELAAADIAAQCDAPTREPVLIKTDFEIDEI